VRTVGGGANLRNVGNWRNMVRGRTTSGWSGLWQFGDAVVPGYCPRARGPLAARAHPPNRLFPSDNLSASTYGDAPG